MSRYYARFKQDSEDKLAYTWNFRRFLKGDSIVSFAITTNLTVIVATSDTSTVTAILGGGTSGQQYDVLCHIVAASGQEKDATIQLTLEQE